MRRRQTPMDLHQQLEAVGVDAIRQQASGDRRVLARIEAASAALGESSALWTHPAWCMVGLPHRRPDDEKPWVRRNGGFHLLVAGGHILDEEGHPRAAGIPYGATARIILLDAQTHVRDDGVVPLGRSMSAWLRRMGMAATGGERGTITAVKGNRTPWAAFRPPA